MDTSNKNTINGYYDPWMADGRATDIDKIGFFNFGYWKGITDNLEMAQINLIETLASFLTRRSGAVLDVACGKGASTKFLTKYFHPSRITGINISERQLQVCRAIAPECNFELMDATKLAFHDATFDNLLCIEAAFHFQTRRDFLAEAYRVLTPGGRLALSDVVIHDLNLLPPKVIERTLATFPPENCLPSLDAYVGDLRKLGFRHVRVEDTTEQSVIALNEFRMRRAESNLDETQDIARLKELEDSRSYWGHAWTWCMAYAIK